MSSFSHNVHRLVGLSLMERLDLKFDLGSGGDDPTLSEDDAELLAKALSALDAAFPFDGPEGVPSVPVVVHPIERADVLVPGEASYFRVNDEGIVPEIWNGTSWQAEVSEGLQGSWSVIPGMVVFTARAGAKTNQGLAPLRYRYLPDGAAAPVENVIAAGWAS